MKKYLTKCLLLLLAVLLPIGLLFGAVLQMPDNRNTTIAATLRYKVPLLQDTPGPRIVFAGGSSSPYGTVCTDVRQATGRNTLCLGATAYLGLPLYLNLLEAYAQPGDILVIAPETSLLEGESTDYSLVWEAAGNNPDIWRNLPLSYWPGVFCTTLPYAQRKWAVRNSPAAGHHPDFGPLGDVITPRTTLLESGYNKQDLLRLEPDRIYKKNLRRINRFAEKMAARDVTVLFAFAPVNQLAVTSTPEQIAAYAQAITDQLHVPVILDQQTALLDGALFYDSNNHLTSEGAALHTQNLIHGLMPYLS